MAFLGALGGLGTALSAVGTVIGGVAAMAQGNAQQAMMEHRAKMERMQANEARAVATREVAERHREGDLMQSKLQARAAASGAGASDPTIIKLGSDIAGRSEYSALFDMWRGENRARGLEDSAAASIAAGDAAKKQGMLAFGGSLFGAAGKTIMGSAGSAQKSYYPGASSASPDAFEEYLYGRRMTGYG